MEYKENLREADKTIEEVIGNFIDENLYSKEFSSFKRITNPQDQKSGIDVLISSDKLNLKDAKVDEKCSAHYCDGSLTTYTFELSFTDRRNRIVDGWFIDRKSKTEYYMLMWLNTTKKRSQWREITSDDILAIEYALVPKNSLKSFLRRNDIDEEELREKCEAIRNGETLETDIDGVSYTYSEQLREKPINIKIDKEILMKLAIFKGIVKKYQ